MGMNGVGWFFLYLNFLDEIYVLFIALDEKRFERLMDEIIKIDL